MQVNEIWSISAERIRSFFLKQHDVQHTENNCFTFGECKICITALPLRQVGQFCFPQTKVDFCGPEIDTQKIYQRFFLQFVSAGG